jgi:hypothetical protein
MVSARLRHVLTLALVFYLVSSPYTYTLVDKLVSPVVSSLVPQLSSVLRIAEGGCPTTYGLLVHTAVFGLVAYYLHQ